MSPETWMAWAFGFLGGAAIINAAWMLATTPRRRMTKPAIGTISWQNETTVMEKSQTPNRESRDPK